MYILHGIFSGMIFSLKSYKNDKANNNTSSKTLEITKDISAFVLVSNNRALGVNLIFNKAVDTLIENLSKEDQITYDSFSYSLDQINSFIKNLENEGSDMRNLDLLIWMRDWEDFHFSKIGNPSCYLYSSGIITEIDYLENRTTEFSYISSGKLKWGDYIALSSTRLLDYLTKTDINDSIELGEVDDVVNNIYEIFEEEAPNENIDLVVIKNCAEIEEIQEENQLSEYAKSVLLRVSDNKYAKRAYAYGLLAKDKVIKQNKHIKSGIFVSGILVSFVLLYALVSGVISVATEKNDKVEYKDLLNKANIVTNIARSNKENKEVFLKNIEEAEMLIEKVKKRGLYAHDISLLNTEIITLKKEFNGIEVFNPLVWEKLFDWDLKDSVKILENNKKIFIVGKKSITWPIFNGQSKGTFEFENIGKDHFIDATFVGNKIYLLTNESQVVSYGENTGFKFVKVIGQEKWEDSSLIRSYSNNLYLINEERNQIFKHRPAVWGYKEWVPYLKNEDIAKYSDIKIKSIDIDGWIYILKENLAIDKFFSSPKYRIESIVLNNLPENYALEEEYKGNVKIVARNDLRYVYFFFNNKIWVFKPNSRRYQDIKSLNYVGQIEGTEEKIKDIFVNYDNINTEIIIAYSNGLYKLNAEVTEEWITIQ